MELVTTTIAAGRDTTAPRGGRPPPGRGFRLINPPIAPPTGRIRLSVKLRSPMSKSSVTVEDEVLPVNVFGEDVEQIAACKDTRIATKKT